MTENHSNLDNDGGSKAVVCASRNPAPPTFLVRADSNEEMMISSFDSNCSKHFHKETSKEWLENLIAIICTPPAEEPLYECKSTRELAPKPQEFVREQ